MVATANPSSSVVYDVLVGAHVVVALVGFGSVAISGVYGAIAARPRGADTEEETGRYFRSKGWAEWSLLAVPFVGAGALAARPGDSQFGQVWVISAALIWLAAAVLLLKVVRPAERSIRTSRGEDRDAATRLKWAAAGCDVLFVAALVLMIGQPR